MAKEPARTWSSNDARCGSGRLWARQCYPSRSSGGQKSGCRTETVGLPSGGIAWTTVEFAQRFEYLVDGDRRFKSNRCPQRWARSDRRCVRRPGCENGAFLADRKRRVCQYIPGCSNTVQGCSSVLKSMTLSSEAVVSRMVSSILWTKPDAARRTTRGILGRWIRPPWPRSGGRCRKTLRRQWRYAAASWLPGSRERVRWSASRCRTRRLSPGHILRG